MLVIQRTLIDITPAQDPAAAARAGAGDVPRGHGVQLRHACLSTLMDSDTFISYEPQHGAGDASAGSSATIRRALAGRNALCTRRTCQPTLDNICNGRGGMFEMRVVTPGAAPGDYRWHRVSSRLILQDGRLSRVVGTIRNIHSMKETLSENSERLHMSQSALQAISGVYVSIFYVNLTEDQYYAVRLPQARGRRCPSRAPAASPGTCANGLLPHVAKGGPPAAVAPRCATGSACSGNSRAISGHTRRWSSARNASDGTAVALAAAGDPPGFDGGGGDQDRHRHPAQHQRGEAAGAGASGGGPGGQAGAGGGV